MIGVVLLKVPSDVSKIVVSIKGNREGLRVKMWEGERKRERVRREVSEVERWKDWEEGEVVEVEVEEGERRRGEVEVVGGGMKEAGAAVEGESSSVEVGSFLLAFLAAFLETSLDPKAGA